MSTTEEVARFFQVHPRSVLRWLEEGAIPAEVNRPNCKRFDLERVRAALRKDAIKSRKGS